MSSKIEVLKYYYQNLMLW